MRGFSSPPQLTFSPGLAAEAGGPISLIFILTYLAMHMPRRIYIPFFSSLLNTLKLGPKSWSLYQLLTSKAHEVSIYRHTNSRDTTSHGTALTDIHQVSTSSTQQQAIRSNGT